MENILKCFQQRARNKQLRKRTMKQLRRAAQHRNIDTSGLVHKWELIDVIEKDRIQNDTNNLAKQTLPVSKQDSTRVCFLDLPGEIRNMIYGYVMISEAPTSASSMRGPHNNMAYLHGVYDHSEGAGMDSHARTFEALSKTNCMIQREVQTFFYANNVFEFFPDRIRGPLNYTTFLRVFPKGGLIRIISLTLKAFSGLRRFYTDCTALFQILAQCKSLKSLLVALPLETLFIGGERAIDQFYRNPYNTKIPGRQLFPLLNALYNLTDLRDLELELMYERERRQEISILEYGSTLLEKRIIKELGRGLRGRGRTMDTSLDIFVVTAQ